MNLTIRDGLYNIFLLISITPPVARLKYLCNSKLRSVFCSLFKIKSSSKIWLTLATGGVIEINKNILYKPSLMVKFTPGFPVNYDINSSFLLNKTLWAGFSYRSTQNLVLLLEWNISDQLRGGYSYDFDLSPLRSSRSGSHELFIGYDFIIKKSLPNISPKYL